MSGLLGIGDGGGGAQGGGLCVFSCATFFSAIGAVAALKGYDIGAESAFFALSGVGALCFAKCQYLRLAEQRSRLHRKNYQLRDNNWEGTDIGRWGEEYKGIRKRRDHTHASSWDDKFFTEESKSKNSSSSRGRKASKIKERDGVGFIL